MKTSFRLYCIAAVIFLVCGCAAPSQTIDQNQNTEPIAAAGVVESATTVDGWLKTYGTEQDIVSDGAVQLEDGGYLLAGTTNLNYDNYTGGDILLVKTDATGEVLWDKLFVEDGEQKGTAISPSLDGGFLISGTTFSPETTGLDIFAMKINLRGEKEWIKVFAGPFDEMGAVKQLRNGKFMAMGSSINPEFFIADPGAAGYDGLEGRSSLYVAKYKADGSELWSQTYGGELNVIGFSGIETEKGGSLLLGSILYFPESGNDIWLLNVDKKGKETWSKYWREGGLTAYDVIETTDGNFLLSGYSVADADTNEKPDILFIKFDAKGNEIWQTTLGAVDMIDTGNILIEAADGSFVTAGGYSENFETWDGDVHLTKVDENGELVWQKVFDTNTHCMFSDLIQREDGGFTIIGSAYLNDTFDMFMIITDANGELIAN